MGQTIPQLDARSDVDETCLFVVDDDIETFKVTASQVRDFVLSGILNQFYVGRIEDWIFKTTPVPTGWLELGTANNTIGSGSSGALARANADTEELFTLFWNNFTNTELPIQDSSGSATTRGASAAADFAANKRMPMYNPSGLVARAVGSQNVNGRSKVGPTNAGDLQEDQIQGHYHDVTDPTHAHSLPANLVHTAGGAGFGDLDTAGAGGEDWGPAGSTSLNTDAASTGLTVIGPITDSTNGTPRTGLDTRVAAYGVRKMIKY